MAALRWNRKGESHGARPKAGIDFVLLEHERFPGSKPGQYAVLVELGERSSFWLGPRGRLRRPYGYRNLREAKASAQRFWNAMSKPSGSKRRRAKPTVNEAARLRTALRRDVH